MRTFKYGDLEFVFDMSDYEHVRRMDAAVGKYKKTAAEVEAMKIKDIEDQLEGMEALFDASVELLVSAANDPDAMKKAIGDSRSLFLASDVIYDFLDFVHTQDAEMTKRWESLATKYSPKVAKPRAAKPRPKK